LDAELRVRTRERLPITVVSLRGTLETGTLACAERELRECLAHMPAALVIEGSGLTVDPSAHRWLLGLAQSATRWPGTPVIVTGEHPDMPTDHALATCPSLDSALMVLKAQPFPERRQLMLPPDPTSCGLARALVSDACAEWGLRRPRRLAQLLISELVANGVMHAGTQLKVTVRKTGDDLELSVRDHGAARMPTDREMEDPHGFGLQLLAALSDDWGWSAAGRGTVVWTRLRGVP
jgi:anti-sigma regulatory factor (Ser/Thr protein kinase)